jgi:hypothetical protein
MSHKSELKLNQLPIWLAVVAVGVILVGFSYLAVQQQYRQSANDPQVQMAEDAASSMNQGGTPVSPAQPINMATSLASIVIVTDNSLKPLSSSGLLNGQIPLPPAGAFTAAKNASDQENTFTWQPASNVRDAAVIVHYKSGYVVAARSLRVVEVREQSLTDMAGLAMLAVIAIPLALFFIARRIS